MLEILLSSFFLVVFNSWLLTVNSMVLFIIYLLLNFNDTGEFNIKLIMFLLTMWLGLMMLLSVNNNLKKKDLLMIFLILFISLMLCFYSESMLMFYLGFEISVIPVLLIIYGWGYQPDRLEAGIYMIIYTVFFSLPLLILIFYLELKMNIYTINCILGILAFLVKLPMFGFHFWLPRAHVEAPMFGSMILAGIMLKLGGYGIFKISYLMGDYFFNNCKLIVLLSIIGGLLLSSICFIQSDMKMLVAYSSVVHMSIVLAGLLSMQEMGLNGAIYMMVGHGFCSSGLFCVLGLTYNRTLTRSLYLNKGILFFMPTCSFWWFLFCSSNLSFPPSLNLPGEILLFITILSWGKFNYLLIMLLGLLSSMYSIFLFAFTQQGQNTNYFSYSNLNLSESLLLSAHWVPLNLFIMDLSLFNI